MKKSRFFMITAMAGLLFTSCSDDDNDTPFAPGVGISVSGDTFSEAEGPITLTFTSTEAFDADVVLTYEVAGSATSGEDFGALPGTLTLATGETSTTLELTLNDDDEVESSEAIVITLTAVDGGTDFIGSANSLTLTLTDNDSFPFENGILVLHEGNFGAGNASVSFVNDDLSLVQNGIFKEVNEVDAWGDTAQSITFNADMAYIVVNNSQKIEVVDRYTFESVGTIGGPGETDFLNPRYMAVANGKGYVTNWGDGSNPDDDFVAVLNLDNNTVESTIAVAEGPEKILAKDDVLYVAHQGGFGQNNIISVIDAVTNAVTTTITVADRPNSMQLVNDELWVLSGGNPSWTGNETAGQLDKVNTTSNTVETTLTFAQTEHPGFLSQDDDSLYYYMSNSIFSMDVTDTALPTTADITDLNFYDMSINEGKLFGVDAKDFLSNGSLEVYDLGDNSLLTSEEVSIIPTGVYFNGDFDF
ncbi:DUF5074 domain-containing protein [Ulvibacterium sp.]|uniref:DUF5074 domain-containing protein n=1 Tax=Ulvibacterium sp. TaxID=2665914 RepID=UPI003CC69902